MVDTVIGKRDIRAVPDASVSSSRRPRADTRRCSSTTSRRTDRTVSVRPTTSSSTSPACVGNATIAAHAGLGERAMAWELTDPAANRQGMTIAEFGEVGGPGMGGCPNGPPAVRSSRAHQRGGARCRAALRSTGSQPWASRHTGDPRLRGPAVAQTPVASRPRSASGSRTPPLPVRPSTACSVLRPTKSK